jgi:hypothetical protein
MTGLECCKKIAVFEYDFDKHGGAVGEITVYGPPIPAGSIITDGRIHVKTAATSGGSATLQIKALSTDDIVTSTAVSALTLNAILATVPTGHAASSILVTSNIRALTFTIGTDTFLTGNIAVALEYIPPTA